MPAHPGLPFGERSNASIVERAAEALDHFHLNDQQRAAAEHCAGPLIVLAGPGTGKTRVLTARILRLLRDGAVPSSILALTFTIKAARQMRERLAERLGDAASEVPLMTFHALAWRLMQRFPDVIGLPAEIQLRDSAQSKRLIREICRREKLFAFRAGEGHGAIAGQLAAFIHDCRAMDRSPEETLAFADRWIERARGLDANDQEAQGEVLNARQFAEAARVYELFDRAARERGLIGFDDSLSMACDLLRHDRFAGPLIRSEIRHLLVDEFQDVNPAQISMLHGLAPPGSGPHAGPPDVMVVGDDDQAIYAFRGANAAAFDRFVESYERDERHPAKVTQQRLEINYRSAPCVIRAGQAIIERAESRFDPEKALRPNPLKPEAELDAGASVEGWTIDGKVGQYGPLILALIERDRAASGRALEKYAVITRNNASADRIAQTLRLANIPVDRRHKRQATDNPGVQDLLAWIQLLVDPGDLSAVQRLLVRPPILAPAERVSRWLAAYARANLQHASDSGSAPESRDEQSTKGFFEWLRGVEADLPAGVRHAAETAERLAVAARTQAADRVIETLIHEAGIVYTAETSADRLELVTDLAAMIRFVRSRLSHVEPPAHLPAFWAYYNDLDPKERAFELGGDEDDDQRLPAEVELDGAADEAQPGTGVTVVTAHSAKGLEFDTVFVVGVRPNEGFPNKRQRASERFAMPEGFAPDAYASAADEERRLFYVACTRAERRLALLAKYKKSQTTSSTDYFLELTHERPELEVQVENGSGLLDEAGFLGDEHTEPPSDADPLRERLRLLARQERHRAFAVLHEAEDAGTDADVLSEIMGRLAAHARALASIRSIERTGSADAERALAGLDDEHRERLAAAIGGTNTDKGSLFKPMRPPLRLSYSSLNAYDHCPRCFWIARELGIDSGLSPELLLGNAVHETLERHFKAVRGLESGESTVAAPEIELSARTVRRVLLSRMPAHMPPDPELLDRAESMVRMAIAEMHEPNAQILEIERRFEIPYRTEDAPTVTHTITGKIDRLDQLPDGTLRIVDYKTGQPRAGLRTPEKKDPQLGIYAMALNALFGGVPAEAEYWVLSTGERGRLGLEDIKFDKVRAWIDKSIRGMLAGEFPRTPGCHGICGVLDLDLQSISS